MQTLSNSQRKARKIHECNFCAEKINIGEKYDHQACVKDGYMYDWKSHLHCSELASRLKMYDSCDEGVTHEDFIEIIQEEYRQIMSDNHNEEYESESFVYPTFHNQLVFVGKECNVLV